MNIFFDNNCPYSVASYYYRVEFQQRGAPHIHCLIWMEDNSGNSAPTFWNCESDNDSGKDDIKIRIKKIEDIASVLISASEDEALCDKHHDELQSKKRETFEEGCKDCYSAQYDFHKCTLHEKNQLDVQNCEGCHQQKLLVREFQTHHHTFTCKKSRKKITIKQNEGHGRLDGIAQGPSILDYDECRFNFPQYPMNKTTLILGIPKNLCKEEVSKRKSDLKQIRKFLAAKQQLYIL